MKTRKRLEAKPLILFFLEILNAIKLFHWKTDSYAAHKASDELHSKLSEHVDRYVEILTRDTRLSLFDVKTTTSNLSRGDLVRKLHSFEDLLKNLNIVNDLANIRDEMLGEIHQFFYLLKLK